MFGFSGKQIAVLVALIIIVPMIVKRTPLASYVS